MHCVAPQPVQLRDVLNRVLKFLFLNELVPALEEDSRNASAKAFGDILPASAYQCFKSDPVFRKRCPWTNVCLGIADPFCRTDAGRLKLGRLCHEEEVEEVIEVIYLHQIDNLAVERHLLKTAVRNGTDL